jgi:hypothetical protein
VEAQRVINALLHLKAGLDTSSGADEFVCWLRNGVAEAGPLLTEDSEQYY